MTAATPFEGKVACVTGASAGLGRAIAEALVGAGAKVVAVARRRSDWCDGTNAVALSADLSDPGRAKGVARAVSDPFGPPDILVNAAGVNTREAADEVTLEGWTLTQNLNLAMPFFLAQALVPGMRERGWGRIVNFASLQSLRAFPGGIAYGASKGGIVQLTRAMAEAWSRHGITANALAPGFFPTELTGPVFDDPERAARNAAQTCIGRNGRLPDIVGPALFLCSAASDYVTGQVLPVDGGFTAK
ncbi:SDR family oxidoreductase [Rhodovulum sulfidophilum]|uniref:SDR family NAD(P)-dependent oxidoreductase n=1 Tax=Rhodovulum sulfidophilum TaxID=35806 RepID=UPI001914A9AD|nr:SDR family oxidoreductase [Rhodovulum sulfidophilum]MBK5925682.1 gluconate 5-dehydrogenase [Rhodovulum sulfidophilum]MBL3567490.1 SDR family oxidoreductase [Rhodovulum sulfidophilum]MBL3595298.1 SDR family oxidoreductase [Rhodovulum sulfidophilum]